MGSQKSSVCASGEAKGRDGTVGTPSIAPATIRPICYFLIFNFFSPRKQEISIFVGVWCRINKGEMSNTESPPSNMYTVPAHNP